MTTTSQSRGDLSQRNAPRCLRITGDKAIDGKVRVAGAKNSILPIMTASLLSDEPLTICNMPHLDDVALMNQVLAGIGIVPDVHGIDQIRLGGRVKSCSVPMGQTRQMRASILVLGPLLARYGEAVLPYPGGCMIGPRPVDMHLKALRTLGAEIEEREDTILARAPRGLTGSLVQFPHSTVGGTENALMAAVLAEGKTVIENAATEPEVIDLAQCLVKMGAEIEGIGSRHLTITGVDKLHSCTHEVIPDRIEAGTYLVAATGTRGKITLENINPKLIENILQPLEKAGASIECGECCVTLDMHNKRPRAVDIVTGPYPEFPTDMQAQFTALNSIAEGKSCVHDRVFDSRVSHVEEMCKMQADIVRDGNLIRVTGKEKLQGTVVRAQDLRASASLVIAGLVAESQTTVLDIEHIDRGYQWLEEQLQTLGVDVTRELYSPDQSS